MIFPKRHNVRKERRQDKFHRFPCRILWKNEKKSNCGDSRPSFMFVCGHYVKQGYIEWSVFWLQIRLFWHRNTRQELAARGFRWVCCFFFLFGCVKPRNTRSLRLKSMWTNPSDSSSELEQNGWKKKINLECLCCQSLNISHSIGKLVGPG